jgi:hypothetical protein
MGKTGCNVKGSWMPKFKVTSNSEKKQGMWKKVVDTFSGSKPKIKSKKLDPKKVSKFEKGFKGKY